jgi:sec-independent protein translocase protein TatB
MFDIGWSELLLIMAIAVIVIGPKEIPAMMQALGRIVRRLQYIRYAFSQQFEDFMQTQDLDDLRNSVNFESKKTPRDFDEAAEDLDVIPSEAVQADEGSKPEQIP